ncbi:MAG: SDR family oxidoreductase [Caulobacteraceae bacterium]
MDLRGKTIVVTGAAQGIGQAMVERFVHEGAKTVIAADLNGPKVEAAAKAAGAVGYPCDVSSDEEVAALVELVEARFGPIDLFCSNAGVFEADIDRDNCAAVPDDLWNRSWKINVLGHVHAARALLPRMIARGGGYFLNTVSAAGLLNQIGSAIYGATKHAAIGFAENLSLTHRHQGIKVSVLCPQAVDTAMLRSGGERPSSASLDGVLSAEQVADAAVNGIAKETFLILPHPEVATYRERKAGDYDRWLSGMNRLRLSLVERLKEGG